MLCLLGLISFEHFILICCRLVIMKIEPQGLGSAVRGSSLNLTAEARRSWIYSLVYKPPGSLVLLHNQTIRGLLPSGGRAKKLQPNALFLKASFQPIICGKQMKNTDNVSF
ncbi:hypothetical protein XENORESO_021099 [Xenotaenia resolanae]|uniref:Uncharacterized protein n=1 Tax=Xenotaenia resolanae TaxID=208358 RepID=A0ABV0VRM8_9TELE